MQDKKGGTIWHHHFFHFSAHPGKIILHPFRHIFNRHYSLKSFAKTLFIVDLVLTGAIIGLLGTIAWYVFVQPISISKLVEVSATVAPNEIVSGAASTLIFRYENRSDSPLTDTHLQFSFPPYFEMLEGDDLHPEISAATYDLGTIEPHTSGSVKLRGVMFGDVGGDQTFTTLMSFIYGDKNRLIKKETEHVFHPIRSTLELGLIMPDHLIEGQTTSGKITYKNSGEYTLPKIEITPDWPDGFELISSSPNLTNGIFSISSLNPGEEGEMDFNGNLPEGESMNFAFHPRFTFDNDSYAQTSLYQTINLLPSQFSVIAELSNEYLNPGESSKLKLKWQEVGEYAIDNVTLELISVPDVIISDQSLLLGDLKPGDSGENEIVFQTSNSPKVNETNLQLIITYSLPDGVTQNIVSKKTIGNVKITTPVVLQSFARYSSPQGDQIGRGPLPPIVGEETKYWIFLTVSGTTSTLQNVKIHAALGDNVVFTEKQSVSVGESITYDPTSNEINWTIGSVNPSINNGVVSVAFEVSLTPDSNMVGTNPILIHAPTISGQDAVTQNTIIERGANVTTNLPYDQMAAGLGQVEM